VKQGFHVPIYLILILLSASPSIRAETYLSSLRPSGSLTLSAQKGLDLDSWDGQLNVSTTDQQGNRIELYETIEAKLHRLPDYFPQWKLNQQLKVNASHPFNDRFDWLITGEANEFRDQFASRHPDTGVGNSSLPGVNPLRPSPSKVNLPNEQRIRDGKLGTGGRWQSGNLSLEALVGVLSDNRGVNERSGIQGDFSASQSKDSLNWLVTGWLARFPDGSDHRLQADLVGQYSFGDDAHDHIGLAYVNGRRFEISSLGADGNARRDDQRLNLTNQLFVVLSKEINFSWESEVNNQEASRDGVNTSRRDREFIWSNGAGVIWTTDKLRTELNGGVDIQQQKYASSLTEGQRSSLGAVFARQIGSSDSLNATCSVLKYRYDTPEERDHNDRDELRYITTLAASHRVTEAFSLRAGTGVDLSHIVYIHADRSGENRWIRQFSVFAETPWNEPPLANIARFSIISHFTDYDFAPFDETASRVFRTATATDTLRLDLGKNWNCEISLAGEVNDNGSLVWDEWLQNVAEEGYAYTFAALPGYQRSNLNFSAGWVFHRRYSELRNSSPGVDGQSVRSDGPIVRLMLQPAPRFYLEASGTSLKVRDRERGVYTLPDLRLMLSWVI